MYIFKAVTKMNLTWNFQIIKKMRELNSFLPSMKLRPFWNSLKPLFQNESSCISVFIRIEIRANYHNNFRT